MCIISRQRAGMPLILGASVNTPEAPRVSYKLIIVDFLFLVIKGLWWSCGRKEREILKLLEAFIFQDPRPPKSQSKCFSF